jgi:hypothetical protein
VSFDVPGPDQETSGSKLDSDVADRVGPKRLAARSPKSLSKTFDQKGPSDWSATPLKLDADVADKWLDAGFCFSELQAAGTENVTDTDAARFSPLEPRVHELLSVIYKVWLSQCEVNAHLFHAEAEPAAPRRANRGIPHRDRWDWQFALQEFEKVNSQLAVTRAGVVTFDIFADEDNTMVPGAFWSFANSCWPHL